MGVEDYIDGSYNVHDNMKMVSDGYNENSNSTLTNVIFKENLATGYSFNNPTMQGGGMYIENSSATLKDVIKKLRGPIGSSVDVTIKRIGQEEFLDVTLVREKIPIFSVHASFMIDESTGYIKINRFASSTAQEVEQALLELEAQDMEQLILDFRNN